jgi:hypothetical protein
MIGIGDLIKDGVLAILVWFFEQLCNFGMWIIGGLLSGLSHFVDFTYIDGFIDIFETVDYFFPLREAIGLGGALFGVWVVMSVYRVVHSWIPTMSG